MEHCVLFLYLVTHREEHHPCWQAYFVPLFLLVALTPVEGESWKRIQLEAAFPHVCLIEKGASVGRLFLYGAIDEVASGTFPWAQISVPDPLSSAMVHPIQCAKACGTPRKV